MSCFGAGGAFGSAAAGGFGSSPECRMVREDRRRDGGDDHERLQQLEIPHLHA
jgi:hypothetical protein